MRYLRIILSCPFIILGCGFLLFGGWIAPQDYMNWLCEKTFVDTLKELKEKGKL